MTEPGLHVALSRTMRLWTFAGRRQQNGSGRGSLPSRTTSMRALVICGEGNLGELLAGPLPMGCRCTSPTYSNPKAGRWTDRWMDGQMDGGWALRLCPARWGRAHSCAICELCIYFELLFFKHPCPVPPGASRLAPRCPSRVGMVGCLVLPLVFHGNSRWGWGRCHEAAPGMDRGTGSPICRDAGAEWGPSSSGSREQLHSISQ